MDPPRAQAVLTHASMLTVPTGSGAAKIFELTDTQKEAIRGSRLRSPAVAAAKKVLKIQSLLNELEADLDEMKITIPAEQRPQAHVAAAAAAKTPAENLAIVPFIATVPIEQAAAAEHEKKKKVHFNVTWRPPPWLTELAKPMLPVFKVWKLALWYAPALVIYMMLLYSVMAVGYLGLHPELFVKFLFGCLDAIPNYASYVSARMFEQLQLELESRLR